jgi:hypothetical protein
MAMRRILGITVVLLLATLAIVASRMRPDEPDAVARKAVRMDSDRAVPADRAIGLVYRSMPVEAAPAEVVAHAMHAALRGSLRATRDYALALKRCHELLSVSPEMLEEKEDRIAQSSRAFFEDNGHPVGEATLRADSRNRLDRELADRDGCSRLEPADVASWEEWIELAAAGGADDAVLAYAQSVLALRSSGHSLSDDIDAVSERKRKAFAFLEARRVRGQCRDLRYMELLAPDATMRYAMAMAWLDHVQAHPDPIAGPLSTENAAFMQAQVDHHAIGLSAAQRATATARAAAVKQTCR